VNGTTTLSMNSMALTWSDGGRLVTKALNT
jgi:hypothetical protein